MLSSSSVNHVLAKTIGLRLSSNPIQVLLNWYKENVHNFQIVNAIYFLDYMVVIDTVIYIT